ncbi:transmembrane protein 165 [Microplitis demolitor]|uniref:transmembrane protein 165 n=1 Tax=Microplitis demolitor TaxID=69319 RepID=UPI0004CCE53C|nr:transmembrane protein 165 [Microplitis demolitor]
MINYLSKMFKLNKLSTSTIIIFTIIYFNPIKVIFAEEFPHDIEKSYQATTEDPSNLDPKITSPGNLGFIHAFIASLSVIIVSELGDKTFFIAAIMAMRHPRLTVFTGAIAALALMTILSVIFGYAATIIPRAYTYYISTALFALFGLKMLKDGYYMAPTEGQEELEEVQLDLRKREDEYEKEEIVTTIQDPETGVIKKSKANPWMLISRIFLQAFSLTFLAEWGDRSQLTTIILAAREDVYGVIVGGVLGHSLCTGLAVLGGRMIAQKISVRTVTIIGGIVFLIFALTALFVSPTEST